MILPRALGFVHVIVIEIHLYHPHLAWGNVVCNERKKNNIMSLFLHEGDNYPFPSILVPVSNMYKQFPKINCFRVVQRNEGVNCY